MEMKSNERMVLVVVEMIDDDTKLEFALTLIRAFVEAHRYKPRDENELACWANTPEGAEVLAKHGLNRSPSMSN
jgi:hypothetical protein